MDSSNPVKNLVTSSINSLSTSFTNILNHVRSTTPHAPLPRPASTTSLKDWQLPPQYRPIRMLGKGAMGKVWLCECLTTGKQVALKLLRRPVPPELLTNLQQEITLHTMLDHPHVVTIQALHLTPTHVIIVMDALLGGTLLSHVQQCANGKAKGALCMGEDRAKMLFRQVLLALQHCHARGVAHRDVKLENLLLTEDTSPRVCLCDFGFATSTAGVVSTTVLHDGAAGVVLCAMLLGTFPYDHAARRDPCDAQLDIYCQQHLRAWSELPALQAPLEQLSHECTSMLNDMLTVEEAHRATIPNLLAHPWMQQHCTPSSPTIPIPKRPVPLPACVIQSFLQAAARSPSASVEWMAVDALAEVSVHLGIKCRDGASTREDTIISVHLVVL